MFHQLPTEVVDQIFIWACRMPVAPPKTYGFYAALTGAGDIDTTTNLMCVCRHFYNVIAPLLYRAPLLVYPWQVAALHRTLKRNPSLALLVEHLFMDYIPMLELVTGYPFAPNDYEAMFHVAPRGTTFPLHYAIEYDVAEFFAVESETMYPPQPEKVRDFEVCEPARAIDSLHNYREVRNILAWLRCAAAYGARNAVSPSEIPRLEARGRDAAERLKTEYFSEQNNCYGGAIGNANMNGEKVGCTTARTGTRFKGTDLLLPDLSVEMPALNTLQLEEYEKLDPNPIWEFLPIIRLTTARALAYGRLNGAGNEHAYAAYLNENHPGTWRNRDEESEPWTAEYRDVPDEEFYQTPLGATLAKCYSCMPGTRLSPAPVYIHGNLAVHEIFSMATRLRTLACRSTDEILPPPPGAFPHLEKLIISYDMKDDTAMSPSPIPVRELVYYPYTYSIRELYNLTRHENVLGNVQRCTLVTSPGYIHLDRTVLDADSSWWHHDDFFPGVARFVNQDHPLVSEFHLEATLSPSDRAALEALHVYRARDKYCATDAMLYLEWLPAAAAYLPFA